MHFDLVVIGSGPAGQKGAINAAKLGRRVAVVEKDRTVGGVCVNTGTIPSKALREAILHTVAYRKRWARQAGDTLGREVTMQELHARTADVVQTEIDIIRDQMTRNGVTVVLGEASFVDAHRIRVLNGNSTRDLTADHVLIAVGSRPHRPPNVPFKQGVVIDSDQILELTELPRSMIVVGGGVIGVEYACMLASVGVHVTLLDKRPRLLDFVDAEVAEALQFHMRENNIRLKLGEALTSVEIEDDDVRATLASGKRLYADTALFASGRQANTDALHLAAAGIEPDERGRVRVNEFFQTQQPHISAAGDVIGFPALAATSMEQGRLATSFMFGQSWDKPSELFPIGIYTIPEISMVGKTEEQLTAENVPFEVGLARYREIARGKLIGDMVGMLKLVFHQDSRRLLGVHILGEGATELIHIGQCAMSAEMPIDYFVSTVFNYPTLAECYRVAALDGLNRVRHVRSAKARAATRPALNGTATEQPAQPAPEPALAGQPGATSR